MRNKIDLEKQLERIENVSIENHYKLGLPRTADRRSTISVIMPDKYHKNFELHHHTFELIQDSNDKNKK